jgi:hypothetical protein
MARDLLTSFGRPGWRVWAAAILAAVVVVAVLVARLVGSGDEQDPTNAAGARPGAADSAAEGESKPGTDSSSPADPNAGYDGPDGEPTDVPATAPRAARAVAENFTSAWANHPDGIEADEWWRRVARYTDESLAESLRSTDPQRVPATRVTGAAKTVSTGRNRALLSVPTDAGPLQVTCVLLQGDWKVTSIDIGPAAGTGS